MPETALSVHQLSKQYVRGPEQTWSLRGVFAEAFPRLAAGLRRHEGNATSVNRGNGSFWALKDVSFDVLSGERVGIIGRNGAGKSTLLKILSRITYPTSGEAHIRGRVTSLLEVGTGFNPALSGRENIYLNASLHGLHRREIDESLEEIVEFSGVRDFLDTPVRHYSSGMFMRLAFSVAAHLDPDILLLDEVLAVGDLSFQEKCLKRVEGLTSEGRTVLFVSHSIDAITRFCTRCLWLDHGRIIQDGPAVEVIEAYVAEVMSVRASRQWLPEATASAKSGSSPRPVKGWAEEGALPAVGPNGDTGAASGNEFVRLVSARVVSADGRTISSVRIDEGFGIEVTYDILKAGKLIQPALHFKTPQGAYVFVVAYTEETYMRKVPPVGRYVATASIPPNLLNIGILHVTVGMNTPDPLERHCTVERALSFNVWEPLDQTEGTARGLYARRFPGLVRPKLVWETRKLAGLELYATAQTAVPNSEVPAPRLPLQS